MTKACVTRPKLVHSYTAAVHFTCFDWKQKLQCPMSNQIPVVLGFLGFFYPPQLHIWWRCHLQSIRTDQVFVQSARKK